MIQRIQTNVFLVPQVYRSNKDVFKYLICADVHWDNPDCKRDLFKKHLDIALEENAPVFIIGDFFCAMQGKYDKRSDKSKLRPEHQKSSYLDTLVETAAEFLLPYQKVIYLISHGNHETSILKNHETDLTARLIERLNTLAGKTDHRAQAGPYGGYIKLYYHRQCTGRAAGGGAKSLLLKYHHGYGGGGAVTKGIIQSQRIAAFASDADVVISGHVHDEYLINYPHERVDHNGLVYISDQWHVRTATYKDEYKTGEGGWHIETGKPPKPIGAWWMHVKVNRTNVATNGHAVNIDYDFLKAK